ncbi:MAG TPA: hypothetical protein VI977_05665 [archaeon]|nr:hypothetical protein [archaeon]
MPILEKNGILTKNNGHYQLNPEWVNQLMQFAKKTKQKMQQEEKNPANTTI